MLIVFSFAWPLVLPFFFFLPSFGLFFITLFYFLCWLINYASLFFFISSCIMVCNIKFELVTVLPSSNITALHIWCGSLAKVYFHSSLPALVLWQPYILDLHVINRTVNRISFKTQLSFKGIFKIKASDVYVPTLPFPMFFFPLYRSRFLSSIMFLPSALKTFFNIYCSAGLLVMNYFSFCISGKYFDYLFERYFHLVLNSRLSTLFLHYLLACVLFQRKSVVIFVLCVM